MSKLKKRVSKSLHSLWGLFEYGFKSKTKSSYDVTNNESTVVISPENPLDQQNSSANDTPDPANTRPSGSSLSNQATRYPDVDGSRPNRPSVASRCHESLECSSTQSHPTRVQGTRGNTNLATKRYLLNKDESCTQYYTSEWKSKSEPDLERRDRYIREISWDKGGAILREAREDNSETVSLGRNHRAESTGGGDLGVQWDNESVDDEGSVLSLRSVKTANSESAKEIRLLSGSRASNSSVGSEASSEQTQRNRLRRRRTSRSRAPRVSASSLGDEGLPEDCSITTNPSYSDRPPFGGRSGTLLRQSRSSSGVTGSCPAMSPPHQAYHPWPCSCQGGGNFDETFMKERRLPPHAKGMVRVGSAPERLTYIHMEGCEQFVLNTSSVSSVTDPGPSVSRNQLAIISESQNTAHIEESTKYVLKDHRASDLFSETRAYHACRRNLAETKFLIITGQDGLTCTGLSLLAESKKTHKFFISNPSDFNLAFLQDDSIVFISHVFGNEEYESKLYRKFQRYLRELESSCRNSDIEVILTVKYGVAEKCVEFLDKRDKNVVDISSDQYTLNENERFDILQRNVVAAKERLKVHVCLADEDENLDSACVHGQRLFIAKSTLKKVARVAFPSSFFSDVHKFLLSGRNVRKGVAFFEDPSPDLFRKVDDMRTSEKLEDKESFLALVTTLVLNGRLDLKNLPKWLEADAHKTGPHVSDISSCTSQKRHEQPDLHFEMPAMLPVLRKLADLWQMSNSLLHHIREGAKRIRGTLLKEGRSNVLIFSAVCVERAVLISCCNSHPEIVLRHCSAEFRRRYVCVQTTSGQESKAIPRVFLESSTVLAQILMDDILNGLVRQSTEHPAMRIPRFVESVFALANKQKRRLLKLLTTGDNVDKMGLAYHGLACAFDYESDIYPQNLAEKILLMVKWREKRLKKQHAPRMLLQERLCLERVCELSLESTYIRLVSELNIPVTAHCLKNAVEAGCQVIVRDILSIKPCLFQFGTLRDIFGLAYRTLAKRQNEGTLANFIKLSKYAGINARFGSDAVVHLAAKDGILPVLAVLKSLNADVNQSNNSGYRPLHLACIQNHELCAKELLSAGASQLLPDWRGDLPVHTATKYGHTGILRILVEDNPNVVVLQDGDGRQPLHLATHAETVLLLIDKGGDVNGEDNQRQTPLHAAAETPSAEIVHLIEAGADVNKRDGRGDTPIFLACRAQNVSAVKLLLTRRHAKSSGLKRCLFEVVRHENEALLDLLLDSGLSINAKNKDDMTLLHFAMVKGLHLAISFLLTRGVDLEVASEGLYPVHVAVQRKDLVVLRQLTEGGASVETRTARDKNTVLHLALALAGQRTDVVAYLLTNFPGLVETQNQTGDTALHMAARQGDLETTLSLLNISSSETAKLRNKMWETPLMLARQYLESCYGANCRGESVTKAETLVRRLERHDLETTV